MGWYDTIESEVRYIVHLLRDHGINTTCSCGHTMEIEAICSDPSFIELIGDLLVEAGYPAWRIEYSVLRDGVCYFRHVYIKIL